MHYDNELVDKWLNALRSGKYHQTTRRLRDFKGYCCYGVLCDIIDPTAWQEVEKVSVKCHTYNGQESMPDSETMGKVGFFSQNMEDGSRFAIMNDQGKTFNEIADELEKYYKKMDEKENGQ